MPSSKESKSNVSTAAAEGAALAAERDLIAELQDPHTHQFLKSYLAITDEQLKAHLRRLVEETRLHNSFDVKKK
ncbi:MAG: hypothetical protein K8S25_13170 [Alphaproteobacteria bacterium]|nr:hypothetical protein [Alphaproteobacteria bacterium]